MKSWKQERHEVDFARGAFTLIEVLLVLALLGLLAAAVWPALDRTLADRRLRGAADTIRAEWARARAEAMSSGVPQRFCYEPDGRGYWLETCEENTDRPAADATTNDKPLDSSATHPGESFLPEEISFFSDEVQIVFYPDGTCLAAQITLRNGHDRGIALSVRELTGVSAAGDIFKLEEGVP